MNINDKEHAEMRWANKAALTDLVQEAIDLLEDAQTKFCFWSWPITIAVNGGGAVIESEEEGQALIAEALREEGEAILAEMFEKIPNIMSAELGNHWPKWVRDAHRDMVSQINTIDFDIKEATRLAEEAVSCLEGGDYQGALRHTRAAANLEDQYGDYPAYRPALEAVEALCGEAALNAQSE